MALSYPLNLMREYTGEHKGLPNSSARKLKDALRLYAKGASNAYIPWKKVLLASSLVMLAGCASPDTQRTSFEECEGLDDLGFGFDAYGCPVVDKDEDIAYDGKNLQVDRFSKMFKYLSDVRDLVHSNGTERVTFFGEQTAKTSASNPDTDGDGIGDGLEISGKEGVQRNSAKIDELSLDPLRKNAILFLDVTHEDSIVPAINLAESLVKSYAQAPLGNPDGSTGITLQPKLGIVEESMQRYDPKDVVRVLEKHSVNKNIAVHGVIVPELNITDPNIPSQFLNLVFPEHRAFALPLWGEDFTSDDFKSADDAKLAEYYRQLRERSAFPLGRAGFGISEHSNPYSEENWKIVEDALKRNVIIDIDSLETSLDETSRPLAQPA